MIKKRRVRLLAFLTVMLLSMTIFSSVALADGSERTCGNAPAYRCAHTCSNAYNPRQRLYQ